MSFFGISLLFVFAILTSTSGLHLCSKSSSDVKCIPCNGEETPYKCPRQCGEDRNHRLCNQVCSSKCIRSECGYDKATELYLRCTHGCVDPYTGPSCTQFCMDGCNKCTQDNSLCLRCERGRYGPTCNTRCYTCKDGRCAMNGTCTRGCKSGFYGEKCLKRCEKCKKCGNDVECDVCNLGDGTCLLGCDYGYFGPSCQLPCGLRCTHCHPQTGKCEQCEKGFMLKKGQCKKSEERNQDGSNLEDIPLVNEEKTTWSQSTSTDTASEVPTMDSEDTRTVTQSTHGEEAETTLTTTDLSESEHVNSYDDIDYLLPAVICLLIVFACTTLVLLWKLRSRFRVDSEKRSDLEDKSLSKPTDQKHPLSLSRSVPLYSEIPELQGKKIGMHRPILLLPGTTASPSLSRSGSTSTTYMTPVEDSEDDLFLPRTATFGFEPQGLSEKSADHWKTSAVTLDDGTVSLVFENDPDNHKYHVKEPFRLKNMIGSYEIPIEYLDKSVSGRSTPRLVDM